MKLSEVCEALSCEVSTGSEELDMEIEFGCASDLMSDVLAFSQSGALLLTGLVNNLTIHTAHIADIKGIVFVRGKKPDAGLVKLAKEVKIPLLCTQYSMYEACGILYKKGLVPTMACDLDKATNG